MNEFWNERYAAAEAAYGKETNAFLVEQLALLNPGSLLLPCDVEGRNALHAAQHGWDVHSFDYSSEGVDKSQRWAREANVTINACVADAFAFEPGQPFDAIGLVFAHMPADRRRAFHERVLSWLRPGGTLILEGFNPDQLQFTSGGPKDPSMLFTEAILREDFAELDVVLCELVRTTLDEGPFHQGPAAVARLVATRRA
jgi:cyclopropane fatty-acyl-phospholipid synthase-like methyltransferase